MDILLVASDGGLVRAAPAEITIAAAEPLRFRIEATGAGVLNAAVRMPSREWDRRIVSMEEHRHVDGQASIDFFATGVAPGRHRIFFEATLESEDGGLVRESSVVGDLVLVAQ